MRQSRACVVCHAEFVARRESRITCSNRCYMYYQDNPGKADGPRACEFCGRPFSPGTNRARKYCGSVDCRKLAAAASKRRNRPIQSEYVRYERCQYCGAELHGKAGRMFCDYVCKHRHYKWPGSHTAFLARHCERCDEPIPVSARRSQIYCTKLCSKLAHVDFRRARKLSLPVERFSRAQIFERDEWRCHICYEAVDPSLSWPDPGCATIDHLIPLSDPGSPGHVWTNVGCAHFRCNGSKRGRTRYEDRQLYVALDATGQPPLVGALF